MDRRRDPLLAASRTALAVRDAAVRHDGVGTVGSVVTTPGIVTAIPEEAAMLIDQRHLDAGELAAMLAEARRAADEACAAEGVTVAWDRIVGIAPRPFDDRLISIAREVCRDLCGHDRLLPSGPLHDATEMAARVPTAMVFSSSSGLSHNRADVMETALKLNKVSAGLSLPGLAFNTTKDAPNFVESMQLMQYDGAKKEWTFIKDDAVLPPGRTAIVDYEGRTRSVG